VVLALEDFNRRRKVAAILAAAGTFPNWPAHDETDAADRERQKLLAHQRGRGK
jgi:hypothetical protein